LFRLFWEISVPQLRASWGRTIIVIGGVATGVALIAAMELINASVLAGFHSTIDQIAGPAALEVTLGVGEVGFPETTVDTIRADPDVAAAVPLVRGTIAFADRPADVLQLFGADLTAEADLERYRVRTMTDRRELLRAMEDPKSVLLPTKLAESNGLGTGAQVAFATPDGIHTLTVRGLLEAEGLAAALGGRLAVMDLPAAQLLLGKEGRVDQVDVIVREGANVADLQRRLESALPSVLTVAHPLQRGERYEGVFASFQAMLVGLSAVGLVAGMFVIYSTTSTGALQRGAAMARLRLIGVERAQLFRLLMFEALLLGLVGSVLGILIAIPLAWLLTGTITDSLGVIFQLRFPVDTLVIQAQRQAAIATVGIGVALFASFFAARRMAMQHPLAAIREAPLMAEHVRSGRLVVSWVLLLAASGAAFWFEHHSKSIAWGNFGSTLWNASVIVIAVPLIRAISQPLSRFLLWAFGAAGDVAAGSLVRAPGRTGVTVAAIALILTIAIMLSSLVVSCRESLRSYFSGFLASDLTVSAVSTEGGWLETPLPGRLLGELASIPGIRAVAGGRIIAGQPFLGQRIGLLALDDLMFDAARVPSGWYREGDPVSAAGPLRAGEAATISTSLSDRFNLHAGDTVELDSPTGLVRLPIVGVVPDYISDRGSVILSRRLLAKRWAETTVSRVNVFLQPDASVQEVRTRILDRLGDRYRLKVLGLRELVDYHTALIDKAFAVMNSVQILIVIVTITAIFDLLISRIAERRRELALWRVVGADARAVRRSVVIESATIGVLGAVLGVAVGYVTAWIWIAIHFRQLLGYYVEYHLAMGATVWYVTLVLLMTALSGYVAASKATGAPILDAIQVE
jgi:putative ABC transport system permease protein